MTNTILYIEDNPDNTTLVRRALEARGYAVGVLSMHTVRPLDSEALLSRAGRTRALVVTEEHLVNGGLGDACARLLLEAGVTPRFRTVAIPDEYTVTGAQEQILDHYGISPFGLEAAMRDLLESR